MGVTPKNLIKKAGYTLMVSKLISILAWFQADPRRFIIVVMLVVTVASMIALVVPSAVALADGPGSGGCCIATRIP